MIDAPFHDAQDAMAAAHCVSAECYRVIAPSIVTPTSLRLQGVRAEQDAALSDLAQISSALRSAEERLKGVDSTFAKLPAYIQKLEMMQGNMVILRENAAKTKQLAEKLTKDLDVGVRREV